MVGHVRRFIFLVMSLVCPLQCMIHELPLPRELEACFRGFASKTSVRQMVGESIGYYCHQQFAWKQSARNNWIHYNMTRQEYDWFSSLLVLPVRGNMDGNGRYGRDEESTIRMRKEIRALTDRERDDYHRAIQLLKADTSIPPNKYDALAGLHQGISIEAAHGGPNFLGWHRVYLIMYENALREKVPHVTVPYWASTLDSKMQHPTQSIVWSEPFFGNGVGFVRTGPFADWSTPSGPLIRNIGDSGGYPFREEDLRNILSQSRSADITEPNALPENNFEFFHGRVHDYVDGQMAVLATSSQDPIFFSHHAYVDFVWEVFRMQQRLKGINPEYDYPDIVNNTLHEGTSPLGFANLRNMDSYSDRFIKNIYGYAPVPSCTTEDMDCGTPYLKCVVNKTEAYCVSSDSSVLPQQPRSTADTSTTLRRDEQNFLNSLNAIADGIQPADRNVRNNNLQMNNVANPSTNMNFIMGHTANDNLFRNLQNANNIWHGVSRNLAWAARTFMPHTRSKRASVSHSRSNTMTPAVAFQQMLGKFGNNVNIQRTIHNVQSNTGGLETRFHGGMIPDMLSGNKLQPNISSPANANRQCPAIPLGQAYQNTYNLNGKSDIRQWVYIPVKIIHRRPPNYKRYTAYPIMDGNISDESDIYAPASYQMLKERFKMGTLATYPTCENRKSGAGAVYIQSSGINYLGNYKEYVIVDHRLAISMATGYVAVKSPVKGATEVMISAFDSCGRVCTPYCRIPESNNGATRPCSGAIRITSEHPKLYGLDYGQTVIDAWTLSGTSNCPRLDENHVFVSFYCDYQETWPFIGTEPPAIVTPPSTESTPTTQSTNFNTMSAAVTCHVGHGCVITDYCRPCVHGVSRRCEGTCTTYAVCEYGVYNVKKCLDGRVFDSTFGHCRAGECVTAGTSHLGSSSWPKDPDSGD